MNTSQPVAFLIRYGARLQLTAVVLDRAKAESLAAHLHGIVEPLYTKEQPCKSN